MLKDIILWYINESIVNLRLYQDNISNYLENSNTKEANDWFVQNAETIVSLNKEIGNVRFNNEKINVVMEGIRNISRISQVDIFYPTLFRSLIVSYFSIFEHYINKVGTVFGLERKNESIIEYINMLYKFSGTGTFNMAIGDKHYKGFREFLLRRNLYVHEYGIITERYLETIKRYKLESSILGFKENEKDYVVGNLLYLPEGYLIISSLITDTLGVTLGVLLYQKTATSEEVGELLDSIKNILLANNDYDVVYDSIYGKLSKFIDLKSYVGFHLGYLEAKKVRRTTFKKVAGGDTWEKEYNNLISEMDISNCTDYEKAYYYAIIEDYDELLKLLTRYVHSTRNSGIISYFLKVRCLCDFLVLKEVEINDIFIKEGVTIILEKNIGFSNFTLLTIRKLKILFN